MDCSKFLNWYSDLRDGLITDPRLLNRLRKHVAQCEACARYDESVRSGVQAMGEIDPSPDFRERLRARMAATAGQPMEPIRHGSTAGMAAALMLAAAVALVIYERSNRVDRVAVAPVVAETPPATPDTLQLRSASPIRVRPIVVVNRGVPFVTFTDLSSSPFQTVSGPQIPVPSDISPAEQVNLPR